MREVTVEFDVPARMRDGVVLRADVYRPSGPGPWPTLVTRAPYGKDLPTVLDPLNPVRAARQGFMVIVQDTRGRYASDGEWDPFRFERRDGYDSVEWAARLPGSNGRVGMYGPSYLGNTQWLAALEQPPSLAAISPALTWADPMDGLFARGGAVELGLAISWSLQVGFEYLHRLGMSSDELRHAVDALIDEYDRLDDDGYWQLPVHEAAAIKRHGLPELGSLRVLAEPGIADWCRVDHRPEGSVRVPTFHTAGWYDVFLQGTLDNYQAMSQADVDSRLIVGAWTHADFADPIGQRPFGLRAGKDMPVHAHGDVNDLQLAWLRGRLTPDPVPELPRAPVRIFVMGRNTWRDESEWPPRRARDERWFLRASGALTTEGPAPDEPASAFTYDPMHPVPTLGGHILLSPGYPSGPLDQVRIEARDDVLVFTSEALQEDLEVLGRVRVVLHAETSGPSTDWVARLCDVLPDGRSLNVCDGILRTSGAAYESRRHEIDLWSTSNVFLRGHRLRVHVTSSSFPRWDRNLNTGNQQERRLQLGRQRIHHRADRPSYIELPIVR